MGMLYDQQLTIVIEKRETQISKETKCSKSKVEENQFIKLGARRLIKKKILSYFYSSTDLKENCTTLRNISVVPISLREVRPLPSSLKILVRGQYDPRRLSDIDDATTRNRTSFRRWISFSPLD